MPACLIGLGSNIGDRHATLEQAVARMGQHAQMSLVARSSWHETVPVGGAADQPHFLNGVVLLETPLPPVSMFAQLQQIELDLGRRREGRWRPRTIDLDLLLYDQLVLESESLVLPHPRMAWRRFVLAPAAEIASSMVHPLIGWNIARLLDHLNATMPYVAITGGIGVGKTRLTEQLAEHVSTHLIAEPFDTGRLERFYAAPTSFAWTTELQFVDDRARLLAASRMSCIDSGRWIISDFWFDQSLAFARVWLPLREQQAYYRYWEQARSSISRPKLIVLLDAPAEELHRRVMVRGRRCECELSVELLDRIRRSIVAEAMAPGHGPVLKLVDLAPDQTLEQVLAAVRSME